MFALLLTLFERIKDSGINLTVDEEKDIIYSIFNVDITDRERFKYAILCNAAHSASEREIVARLLDDMMFNNRGLSPNVTDLADRIAKDTYAKKEFIKQFLKDRSIINLLANLKSHNLIEDSAVLDKLSDALVWERGIDEFFELINNEKILKDDIKKIFELLFQSPNNAKATSQLKTSTRREINFLDFNEINNEDLELLRQSIKNAASKLRRKISHNYKKHHSGIIDLHRTIRKNIAFENVPFKIVYKKRRMKKRDIIILCDMSQSVRNSALIMITFINELSLLFNRVRSFAFVNNIDEITDIVAKKDLSTIVNSILMGGVKNLFGNSNYSLVFYKFYKEYHNILDKNTILIIIGDGRNNYNEPNLFDLYNIRKKINRLYWFVPEPRELWGKGDSQLLTYLKIVDRAFTTTNLAQLSSAMMKIAG